MRRALAAPNVALQKNKSIDKRAKIKMPAKKILRRLKK
jgi:hypothetical protein